MKNWNKSSRCSYSWEIQIGFFFLRHLTLTELLSFAIQKQLSGDSHCFSVKLLLNQVHSIDYVSPLIASPNLHHAVPLLEQVEKIHCLQQLIGEL